MSTEEPFLLILKNGPIHAVDDHVGYQLRALSRRFRGEMWVTGSFEADEPIARFRLRVVQETQSGRMKLLARYASALLRRVREIDHEISSPKAIITYDPFRNGLLGRLAKSATGWPLIVEVNGAYGNPDNFADAHGLVGTKIKPAIMRFVGRRVLAGADGIRLLYNEQLSNFAQPSDRAIVRQYFDGVPVERFAPAPEEPMLLHLGYPFRRKGVDILIAAFAKLKTEFPHWKLVLIGHHLGRQIPHPPEGVTVMPGIHNQQAAEWVGRCGIFVLASRSEAMGRVLIEAAAAAKPRVAARVDGTYTMISHESDGLLFEKGNVDSLVLALRRLMGDGELRQKMGTAARERALREFGEAQYVDHVSELVSAVINRAK